MHPWCLPIVLWYQPGNQRNPPPTSRKSRIPDMPTQSVLILTVPLVVYNNPQLHPWCLPHTFQIPDWKLEEGMRLDSLQWLVACVWPDSNESCTCGRCSALSDELFSGSQCHLICITQDIRYHRPGQPIKPVSMETWKLILTVLPICSVQRQKHACCLLFFLWCQHGNQRNSSTTQQH